MMELEIGGKPYSFRFGIGFVKEITTQAKTLGVDQDTALRYTIAQLLDHNVIALERALMAANKTCTPRLTVSQLDAWIEDESTDIDAAFDAVIDFLSASNCTRRETSDLMQAYQTLKKEQESK